MFMYWPKDEQLPRSGSTEWVKKHEVVEQMIEQRYTFFFKKRTSFYADFLG